jgi:hypothetical protein
MRQASHRQHTATDSIKGNRRMFKRLATLATIIGGALLLLALLPIASASAESPWWQVLTGSHPTNLWKADDNIQEIKTEVGEPFPGFEGVAAGIEVNGKVVGCIGTADLVGAAFCEGGFGVPPASTAAELESILKTAFGTTEVEVSGGPAGGEPFLVTVSGQGAPTIQFAEAPRAGSVSATVLSPGGSGRLFLTITNLGDAPVDATTTPVTIVDKLPEGVLATGTEAFGGIQGKAGPVDCAVEAPDEVSCAFKGTLPPYEAIEVEIYASLTGNPPAAGAPGQVSVSGGNAPSAGGVQTVKVSEEATPFGIEQFSSQSEEEGGGPTTQAGRHPFQLTTTIQLNSGPVTPAPTRRESITEQPAVPRNVDVSLPPGLIGNATVMPHCDMATFLAVVDLINACPDESAIGATSSTVIEHNIFGFVRLAVPVFNLPPARGEPARFGFVAAGAPVVIDTSIDPENGYRITSSVSNITQIAQFLSSTLSIWGTPGDPRHDNARGWNCISRVSNPGLPCERPSGLSEAAFLRQPVSCNTGLAFGVELEPWNVPLGSVVDAKTSASDSMVACNQVPFDPTIASSATSKLAANPSGLDFRLDMPNSGLMKANAIAEGQAKKVEVTLPEGMTVNPSAAEGLVSCSPADLARETASSGPGEGCPQASKLGDVQISTPLLEEEARGSLYLATPRDNPFGSLISLYIVAKIPERGVLIEQAGKVEPDPKTGQLVTTFDNLPQVPFTSFKLHFREGGRAPLVTPPTCGTHDVVARFTPWSAADPSNPAPNEVVNRTSSFTIERGVDGGACPAGGVPPFIPGFEAGTLNNSAGRYSPFYMRLSRRDGDQDMTKFSSVLPPGLSGKLAGVSYCPEAAIAQARSRTGLQELASPSCPASSKIGRTLAGAGVGSQLTYVPGSLYLAGPVGRAPLSVVAVVPAVTGPFDVGTVVVREGLTLNPLTAEVEVDGASSEPIPHILAGIPLRLRDLRVYVDRDDFTLNPTSCAPSVARATLYGSHLDLFDPADDVPASLTSRFQAADCANLGFKPRLALKLKGGTKRGANPALTGIYRPRPGDANLKSLVLRLPHSAFLDQAHIRTICTRAQFAADSCPPAAIYGNAVAYTPLLDQPLRGPVYLRSSSHQLPDLVVDLHGVVDVEAVAHIDSVQGGIRATFAAVPDAPLTKVVVQMQGARKGLIVNSTNLCKSRSKAKADLTGQNGRPHLLRPALEPQCEKVHKRSR